MLPFWVDPFRHWDCVNALLSRVCLRVLQNGLERERNEGEASAAVELALELHPEQRIRTHVRGDEQGSRGRCGAMSVLLNNII